MFEYVVSLQQTTANKFSLRMKSVTDIKITGTEEHWKKLATQTTFTVKKEIYIITQLHCALRIQELK